MSSSHNYHCCQLDNQQQKSKKVDERNKWCDKISMDVFNCNSWIHIILDDRCTAARIKIIHEEDHIPYCVIDVPEDVKAMVQGGKDKTPSQVCCIIMIGNLSHVATLKL